MQRPVYTNAPRDWGNDELSDFFNRAVWNSWSTFANQQEWFSLIRRVDAVFARLTATLRDPPNLIAAFLLVRSHSALRAAAGLAVATQLPESYVLLRSALEYPAYGLLLEGSTGLMDTWLSRDDDPASSARARKAITWGAAKAAVRARDESGVHADRLETLYDRCLSYGGHPNGQGVFTNVRMSPSINNDDTQFTVTHLSADSDSVRLALKTTAQVGLAALLVWRMVYPLKFTLLLLDDELAAIADFGI
jgi:hypothetical protein